MRLGDRLSRAFLRWNRVLLAFVLALPLTVSMGLGFFWLHEQGWLTWFVLGSVGFYAVVRIILAIANWIARRRAGQEDATEFDHPEADPDWHPAETAAFERARKTIRSRLAEPLPWAELPAEALAVVESVAADMSNGQRSALDFTVPEALLLVDRVATRYRSFLLENLPYSDRLSVRTMHWIWRNQGAAKSAWETGFMAWRGVRLFLNPAVGVLREAERTLAAGVQSDLTEGMRRDAQAILLEEAAQAAIDLYSGRLKFTEAELARIAQGHDPKLTPSAHPPLRVVVVGQKGAGKSALIGALRGEVSDAVSTAHAGAYDWALEGHDLTLIDLPGLDGSTRRRKACLEQIEQADLVLWVHRANRPGRGADAELLQALALKSDADPTRPELPVVHTACGMDALVPGWPRQEHQLTHQDHSTIDAATASISAVMQGAAIIPVSANSPEWNLPALRRAVAAQLGPARRSQRYRLRQVAARSEGGVLDNLARARRGIGTVFRRFTGSDTPDA